MTLGERLKMLRRDSGLSQEAIGAQGFISTPGWIKLENGQRSPSELLIEKLVNWLVADKYVRASASKELKSELLTLKYLASHAPFLQSLARNQAKGLPQVASLPARKAAPKPTRGRAKVSYSR